MTTDSKRIFELRAKAIAYYKNNGVPQRMEEVLNSMFYESPEDAFGFLANYFEKLCDRPVVSDMKATKAIDSRGNPALGIEIYCKYKNKSNLYTRLIHPNTTRCYDHATGDDQDAEFQRQSHFLEVASALINNELGSLCVKADLDPAEQRKVDALLLEGISTMEEEAKRAAEPTAPAEGADGGADVSAEHPTEQGAKADSTPEQKKVAKVSAKGKKGAGAKEIIVIPDDPPEILTPGCNALGAISMAVCVTGARTLDIDLHSHVARLAGQSEQRQIPLPMITLLAGGKAYQGKSNCVKEFMVVPQPGLDPDTILKDVTAIYKKLSKTLQAKSGTTGTLVTDVGALCLAMDRPEQGLDIILDTLEQLKLKENYFLALNLAGHELFDYDKGKYEVLTNTFKSGDELVDFYSELMGRYPQVVAIIDPMRKQEREAWMRLAERLSERCLIASGRAYPRPGLLLGQTLVPEFQTSAWVVELDERTVLSELIDCVQKMKHENNQIIFNVNRADCSQDWIVDLAVGLGADFLKLGAPCRGERVTKLMRWHQIAAASFTAPTTTEEQSSNGGPRVVAGLKFPKIVAPVPPPTNDDGTVGGPTDTDGDKKKKK